MPRFSVVIPTHNRAATLRFALADVLAQGFTDFEVIVVVDGSTDTTVTDLADLSDRRLHVIVREPGGPCRARNVGAAAARGEWLVFLDDDDRVQPDWLCVLEQHSNDTKVGMVCCATTLVDEEDNFLGLAFPTQLGALYGNAEAQFAPAAFAVRKSLFEAVGGYDPLMTWGENFELGLRLTIAGQARGLQIAIDRRSPIRWTRRPKATPPNRAQDVYGGAVRMLESHGDRLADHQDMLWTTLSIAGVNAARLGLMRDAQRHLARAARVRPGRVKSWLRLAVVLSPRFARRVWRDD